MRHFIYISLSVVTLIGITGCGSSPAKVVAAECMFPNSKEAAPVWVCDGPVEGVAVSAVGISAKSQAGTAFMKQMAAADARVQLAQSVRIQVANMIKQYAETTGAASQETVDKVNSSVTKQITNESLVGSKIFRSTTGPDGSLFVLVGLDEAGTQKIVEAAINTSLNNDRAAWQQFRALKGQEELAADIAKQKGEFDKQKGGTEAPKN